MRWKIPALVAVCAVCATLPAQADAQSRSGEGLTRIELLALQQEMRDRGCGNKRAPGVMNAETRRAIGVCSQRLGVTGGARALLAAFNNGFAGNDSPPPGRDDRTPVVGELGTHPVRAAQPAARTTPATRAKPATPARPATLEHPATPPKKPATP